MLPINVTTNITQASNSKACDARGILHKEGKYEKKRPETVDKSGSIKEQRNIYPVHCFIMLPSRFVILFFEGWLVMISVTAVKQQSSQTEREPKSD